MALQYIVLMLLLFAMPAPTMHNTINTCKNILDVTCFYKFTNLLKTDAHLEIVYVY